ncbi:MAG TPA: hypothetical protein VMJ10_20140 [Kofleriaceae bacterium]|nr:hypothetical protein [Kofleriaceae bacterium]
MQDVRWPLLKRLLVEDGWVWRENTLYAPHETMWFTTSSDSPDYAEFRDRMTETLERVDQSDLHDDLVSLVSALDTVLRGN